MFTIQVNYNLLELSTYRLSKSYAEYNFTWDIVNKSHFNFLLTDTFGRFANPGTVALTVAPDTSLDLPVLPALITDLWAVVSGVGQQAEGAGVDGFRQTTVHIWLGRIWDVRVIRREEKREEKRDKSQLFIKMENAQELKQAQKIMNNKLMEERRKNE